MRTIRLLLAAVLSFGASHLLAQGPVIVSFHRNGELTWTNPVGTNAFTVEWAPAAAGPWQGDWSSLSSIITTGTQSTVSVPMFYRVSQGFTDAALRGPWLLTEVTGVDQYHFLIFDGEGTIAEAAIFHPGIPVGFYSVQSDGTITVTTLSNKHEPEAIRCRFVSRQEVGFDPPYSTCRMARILDRSKCQGHWSGVLRQTGGSERAVSFDVNASGFISNFSGLPSFVTGGMFADSSNRVSTFLRTGAPGTDPYNQVAISATLSDNVLTGIFALDCEQDYSGSLSLQRQ